MTSRSTVVGTRVDSYRHLALTTVPFLLVLVFFFVSGACGLLYQVVWTRKLVLLFGTTAYAVSTVLSIFFLGLGIGSLWGGRLADRSGNPLRLYGYFEILVGVWAFVFIVFIDWGENLVAELLRATSSSRGAGTALRAVLAGLFLLVPVTLMGATLPLLAKAIGQARETRGLRIGLLYVLNTAGAVSGCMVTGFYLIETIGYTRSTFIGAAANIGVGVLAVLIAPLLDAVPQTAPDRLPHEDEHAVVGARTVLVVFAAFAGSGFCTLALEVLWTRLLSLVFLGSTYAYTTMLASILVGIASGSLLAALVTDRVKDAVAALGVVELLAGIACMASLIFIAQLPDWSVTLGAGRNADMSGMVRTYFMLSFLVLLMPTLLFGMTFPLAVRAVTGHISRLGQDIGALYSVNTFGGVVGAAAGGYAILPLLGAHRGVLFLSLVLSAIGLALTFAGPRQGLAFKSSTAALACAFTALTFARLPDDASRALNRSYLPPAHRVLAYKEGVEGTVVVAEPEHNRGGSNRGLWINGVQATLSIERGVRMNRFQGVLPFVFDRDPKNALLICFGSGITAGTLATSDLESVTGVEISRDVLDVAHLFEVDNWDALKNPRLKLVVDDGRNFLLARAELYDIITFEPMPLAVAGVAAFYSTEFYELCRSRLSDRGIVVQWLPLHSLNLDVVRSLMRTFRRVFPECSVWFINADLFLVGSREPLRIDYANAKQRMADSRVANGMREAGVGDLEELLSCHFMSRAGVERFCGDGMIMTDDRPWAEFVAPRLMRGNNVGECVRELRPYYEGPQSILSLAGIDERERQTIAESLERRRAARVITLEGIEVAYEHGPLGDPEQYFQKALEVDPNDYSAQTYYRMLAPQRFALLLRWQEFAKAETYIEAYARYMPGNPELWRLRGDLYTALGDDEKANAAYQNYADAGGVEGGR